MQIRIFLSAFNAGTSLQRLLNEYLDVTYVLSAHGHTLHVLLINDGSTDNTPSLINEAQKKYSWLHSKHNPKNLGYATNIVTGYRWGINSDADIVGCMDADGEHSPYAFIRHLRMIENGECDGVVGSIIFPNTDDIHHYHDHNMMRFWGGMQSALAGIDGVFHIQSPGYNLHQAHRVKKALELFDEYKAFFMENTTEPFPRWGLHGVMIHLIAVGTGAHIRAAYLECFGHSPNRTQKKLLQQAHAADIHIGMLSKFLPHPKHTFQKSISPSL